MWSSSPYDAAPPFIWGPVVRVGVSFTDSTLAGRRDTSTGKPPVFAHSRRTGAPRLRPGVPDRSGRPSAALDRGLDPLQRRPDACGQLLVVTAGAPDERRHQLGGGGERRQLALSCEAGARRRRRDLVAPGRAALAGLPRDSLARLIAHHLRGRGPHRPSTTVQA